MNVSEKPLFSFLYDGKPFSETLPEVQKTVSVSQRGDVRESVICYALPDGLEIVQSCKEYPAFGAYEWVLNFRNHSDRDSGIISELYDCDAGFPFEYDKRPESPAFIPPPETTKILNPIGSLCVHNDWYADADEVGVVGSKPNYIFPGEQKIYATSGGRSSQAKAPFFNVSRLDRGIIFAIGWTGQWHCSISRSDNDVIVKTGIENLRFRLYPHEEIRTSSIVIMPYEDGQTNAFNRWRRLIKAHFSLIGSPGRPKEGPFCNMFWGAVSSEKLVDRINKIGENHLGYEYMWIDAGWYGDSTMLCPNEFEGDWGGHTGNWKINPNKHPDGFKDVVEAIRRNNMKFLLWFEPERVIISTPIVQEHPEYFLHRKDEQQSGGNILLDLGNEKAWQYCFDLLSDYIVKLGIDCYRQDFNFDPLVYWRDNDEEDRQGILEIKHISGMYRLWDALLEKFPHLIIDNCASGGRRIDIETLRRSIPLWRSDYQCPANADPEASQMHSMGFNRWMPYSGTGTGRVVNDTYRIRSNYGAAMASNYWYTYMEDFDRYDAETLQWMKKTNAEYLKVRPYFSCDFYPLTDNAYDQGAWCAWQFDRPEQKDGIVMIFKRPKSKGISYRFDLGGISEGSTYTFTDADTNESFTVNGNAIARDGFTVTIQRQRSAKLYFYSKL